MDLHISKHLFLGEVEINHLKQSIVDRGYRNYIQQITSSYGVIKTNSDPLFNALKITQGTDPSLISLSSGKALDKVGRFIEVDNNIIDIMSIPTDNVVRYIIIEWNEDTYEKGTVSLTANGQLTGIGTSFLKQLRGLPNFPSKIAFDSVNNTLEYTIASVTSDTVAQLNIGSGQLIGESNLNYRVVGTFTPGVSPSPTDKFPLRKNGYTLTINNSNSVTQGEQFILASVQSDGTTLTITDLREQNIYSITSSVGGDNFQTSNPFIGLESIKYSGLRASHNTNRVTIGWGLKISTGDWSMNQPISEITITAGEGGTLKDLSPINTGDFNDWYLFHKDSGRLIKIIQSIKVGLDVVLITESLPTLDLTSDITIVPSMEGVELIITSSSIPSLETTYYFPIHLAQGIIDVPASSISSSCLIKWRAVNGLQSGPISFLNTGDYLKENQWDANGFPIDSTYSTYTSGNALTIQLNPLNLYDNKASRTFDNVFINNNLFENVDATIGGQRINTFNTRVIFNRTLELSSGTVTPVDLTDAHLTSLSNSNVDIYFPPDGGVPDRFKRIRGILRPFSEANDGDILIVTMRSDSEPNISLTLIHNWDVALPGAAMLLRANRDITLSPGDSIVFKYDSTILKWIEVVSQQSPTTVTNTLTLIDDLTVTGVVDSFIDGSIKYNRVGRQVDVEVFVRLATSGGGISRIAINDVVGNNLLPTPAASSGSLISPINGAIIDYAAGTPRFSAVGNVVWISLVDKIFLQKYDGSGVTADSNGEASFLASFSYFIDN